MQAIVEVAFALLKNQLDFLQDFGIFGAGLALCDEGTGTKKQQTKEDGSHFFFGFASRSAGSDSLGATLDCLRSDCACSHCE